MSQCRDAALAKAAGQEPYVRRIHEATVGFDHLRLWDSGPLVERDGRLIRADANTDTFPRIEQAMKYLRGGGFTEWSPAPIQQLSLLARQGGPLVTLTRGDVTVKVAPIVAGQVRQIIYSDQPLLQIQPFNARVPKYYPLRGSANEDLIKSATVDGAATAGKVRLQAYNGPLAAEKNSPLWKTVELDANGAIVITTSGQLGVLPDKQRQHGIICTTVYNAGRNHQAIRVESLDASGQWNPLPLETKAAPADVDETVLESGQPVAQTQPRGGSLKASQAFRIHLPDAKCIVTDRYGPGKIKYGKIEIDPQAGSLTTIITVLLPDRPLKEDGLMLERRIELVGEANNGK